jgi:hypothetical protein
VQAGHLKAQSRLLEAIVRRGKDGHLPKGTASKRGWGALAAAQDGDVIWRAELSQSIEEAQDVLADAALRVVQQASVNAYAHVMPKPL